VASARQVQINDLDHALIWVCRDGFPGHLENENLEVARRTLQQPPGFDAVLIDAGASTFYLITPKTVEEVRLAGEATDVRAMRDRATGYAMPGDDAGLGVGDGATLAGYPLGWSLISFKCSKGCSVLLTRYPPTPLKCPRHGAPMRITK
jgi:hypothetical protein